ncbi:MAG: hypothetical protein JOZ18_23005, partial [Chloroflexi bacterium]|nr:hypothetical protein [Chloroflexota bacterium]
MADKSSINYEQIFKSLLSAVPLPVFVIDRTLNICHANKYGLRSCGLTRLIPDTKLDQVVPDPAIVQLAQECISTGKPQNGQYDKSGSDNAWRVSITPLAHRSEKAKKRVQQDSWGEQVAYEYFAVIIEDLAEPRRLERVQRDFLANISHELRTPLTSVRLLAETLEDTIETDPERAQQFVEKIETEVEYLSGLVGELLELSRIESGQLPMTIEPIGAEQLVHEVMARMLPQAQRHRVRLRTEVAGGNNQVAADSKLITRVLFNLVHNAIKFTPSGG